jgi:hypothetical protein
MFTRIEKLGDRLLSMVVPHAQASARCRCYREGVCDRTRDKWKCSCADPGCTAPAWYRCATRNPCS